jgi:hypothetical protein
VRQLLTALCLAATTAACLALIPVSRAAACSCLMGTQQEALARASVVFEGVVAAGPRDAVAPLAPGFGDVVFRFVVDDAVKGGPLPERIDIATSIDGASCGAGFDIGQRWRVYASAENGVLFSGLCSGNELLAERAAIPPVSTGPPISDSTSLPPQLLLAVGVACALALASTLAFRISRSRR